MSVSRTSYRRLFQDAAWFWSRTVLQIYRQRCTETNLSLVPPVSSALGQSALALSAHLEAGAKRKKTCSSCSNSTTALCCRTRSHGCVVQLYAFLARNSDFHTYEGYAGPKRVAKRYKLLPLAVHYGATAIQRRGKCGS